jgi:hypothetical protein
MSTQGRDNALDRDNKLSRHEHRVLEKNTNGCLTPGIAGE